MKGGMHRGPRIGVDAKKNLIVTAPAVFDDAEFQKKYPTADLYVVTSADGGESWSRPARVNESSKDAPEALHWLAVTPSGEAHVAWLDRRGRQDPGQDIFYAKLAGGRIGKNQRIANMVCECCAPGLAVDASGNAWLSFREGGQKPSREVFAIRSVDQGATFSLPVQVNRRPTQELGCPMSAPSVAVSPDGEKLVIAWKDVRTGRNDPHVYWAVSDKPGQFHDTPIDFVSSAKQNHPCAALDDAGSAWVAWEDTRSGTQQIWARNESSRDSVPVSDVTEGEASFPTLVARGGMIAVVYEISKGGTNAVRFRIVRAP
jgi:hypothetical protein